MTKPIDGALRPSQLQRAVQDQETGKGEVARPNWEYIRIDVLLMEHPKIEGLSDKAFRALVDLWCYCGRNRSDGIVTDRRWKQVAPRVRAELAAALLAEPIDIGGGAVMHDYTAYNRSREQIDELSARRAEAGRKGGSSRSKPEASA